MSDSTKFPSLVQFQWSTKASPDPKLAAPIDADDTTLVFTSAPTDEDGNVVTGDFLMGIRNSDSYVETVYVPAAAMSVDGLTATGVVRGVDPTGLDYNTTNGDFAASHDQGSPVFCNVTATRATMFRHALQGINDYATGGTSFVIGDETDSTVTIKRAKSGAVEGFLRLNDSTGKVQYQNSPAGSWVDIDSVSASNLVEVSGTDTTPGYLGVKINAGDGLDQSVGSGGGNETVDIAVDVTDIIDTGAGLTESGNDIQVNLDTDPGLEFNGGPLRVKVKAAGGITRDSDGLSLTDAVYPTTTGIAHEAIGEGDAIAELPVQVEYYEGLTDSDADLGDANARRRYGVSLVTKKTYTGSAPFNRVRAKKYASGQDLVIRIETDNSGEPSGTLVDANATATITAASLSTSYSDETVTWGGSFTLTKGTQYWVVFQVASTDGTNYVAVSTNDDGTIAPNYLDFERLTYDLDSATWGNSTTSACPWFWHTSGPQLGYGLVKCSAAYGGRTWSFVGIADAAYSADEDVTYYHDLVPTDDLSLSLTANKNYYLDTTAGSLMATAQDYDFSENTPVYNYNIGRTTVDKDGNVLLKINPGRKSIAVYIDGTTTDESIYIQTWFDNVRIRSYTQLSAGGLGIGTATSTSQIAISDDYAVSTAVLYGEISGQNMRLGSAMNDAITEIIIDETGGDTIKSVVEIYQA